LRHLDVKGFHRSGDPDHILALGLLGVGPTTDGVLQTVLHAGDLQAAGELQSAGELQPAESSSCVWRGLLGSAVPDASIPLDKAHEINVAPRSL